MKRAKVGTSYIMDIESREHIAFDHLGDDITDSASPSYSDVDIIGRSSPIKTYSNTGSRSIALDLNFVSSYGQDDLSSEDLGVPIAELDLIVSSPFGELTDAIASYETDSSIPTRVISVLKKVSFLRSLAYPNYYPVVTGHLVFPPSRVLLSVGGFIKMVGVVTQCSVTWKRPWADYMGGIPMLAQVALGVDSVVDRPFGAYDVRQGLDLNAGSEFETTIRGGMADPYSTLKVGGY